MQYIRCTVFKFQKVIQWAIEIALSFVSLLKISVIHRSEKDSSILARLMLIIQRYYLSLVEKWT